MGRAGAFSSERSSKRSALSSRGGLSRIPRNYQKKRDCLEEFLSVRALLGLSARFGVLDRGFAIRIWEIKGGPFQEDLNQQFFLGSLHLPPQSGIQQVSPVPGWLPSSYMRPLAQKEVSILSFCLNHGVTVMDKARASADVKEHRLMHVSGFLKRTWPTSI